MQHQYWPPCTSFQALNDDHLMKIRVAKYVVPVSLMAFIFNIPKCLEAKVEYFDENQINDNFNITQNENDTEKVISTIIGWF